MTTKFPADGKTYVGWLADDTGTAITDIEAPETAELASIVDLSCDITSGGLNLGISTGRVDGNSLCSDTEQQSLGRTTFAPTLTFWRYEQPDDTAWELTEKGAKGWLLVRTGVEHDTALADGQALDVLAYVTMSNPAPEYPGGDTNATFNVEFVLEDGRKFSQTAVIGGAS